MDENLVNENAKWKACPVYMFSSSSRTFEPVNFARPGSSQVGVELGNLEKDKLTIVTLNILFDQYDKEKIHTEKRYPQLLTLLEELDAEIIALQEVTDQFLKYLVKSSWIINNNYYISEIPGGATCDPYGNMIISKHPFAMEMCRYSPTKRAIAGFFKVNNKIFGMPVVHLISNHSGGAKRREKEMKVIWKHLSKVADEHLFVGDFNFREDDEHGNSVTQDNQFVDVWKSLYPLEHGISFNPKENFICKETSDKGLPWRYDRMYLHSKNWKPKSMELVGNNGTPTEIEGKTVNVFVSDHYGLLAEFEYKPSSKKKENTIANFLDSYRLQLSPEDGQKREEVLRVLAEILQPLGSFRLQPIGSYLIGSATPSSDIDVVCLGNLPSTQFMAKAFKLIQQSTEVKHVRSVPDALVPIIVIHFSGGVQVELQYGCVLQSEPVDPKLDFNATFTFQKMSKLDTSAVRVVNGYFDTDIILKKVKDRKVFADALSFIKAWAKINGIDNNKLGFIGGLGWSVMLAYVNENTPGETSEELVRNFFKTFSAWDWSATPVALSSVQKLPSHDPERDWLPILQPTRPYRIITRNATLSTQKIVKAALLSAHTKLQQPHTEWEDLVVSTSLAPFKYCKAFVRVTVSSTKRNDFIELVNYVESRFVSLVCQFEAKFHRRILLHPLCKPFNNKNKNVHHAFSWLYLFGIYHVEDPYNERDYDFHEFLRGFQEEINQWQGKNEHMFIYVGQIERRELPAISFSMGAQKRGSRKTDSKGIAFKNANLSPLSTSPLSTSPVLDSPVPQFTAIKEESAVFSFGTVVNEEGDGKAEKEEGEVAINENANQEEGKEGESGKKRPPKKKKEGNKKAGGNNNNKKGGEDEEEEVKPKSRPAEEIYKKIKFNPMVDSSEYVIGYLDRFTGIQEIPFDDFLADKLNPKGVPMHRIRYYKHNGEIIWDREKKIDRFLK